MPSGSGRFCIEEVRKHPMKTIQIKGMSCNHCVMAVTKALASIEGIKDISVDLKKGEASFEETSPVDMNIIREWIRNAGYETD